MCGIFGYTGQRPALPILLQGLKALEYRGYDSAGVFIPPNLITKSLGPVQNLVKKIPRDIKSVSGIAHTRWATHGPPSERNAHPHHDHHYQVWVVHNGIIENYREIKDSLAKHGYRFRSETDSEVIPHLISHKLTTGASLKEATISALRILEGTYGIVASFRDYPSTLIAARFGSPLVLGINDDEVFVASDPSALIYYTRQVLYLQDGEIAILNPRGIEIINLELEPIDRQPESIEWDTNQVQKQGYAHFMLKEIMEQPQVVKDTIRGRIVLDQGISKLGGLESITPPSRLRETKRLYIVGCGSASYAGMVGKYMIEEYARIPTELETGSEFRYRNIVFEENSAILAISQSGETADTLAAIREARHRGVLTLGIVNMVGSTIARETDAGVYNHAGPEIAVASTKAFLSQLVVLTLLTVYLGRQRSIPISSAQTILRELSELPSKIDLILKKANKIKALAVKYMKYRNFLYIGRKYSYPVALEGAIKLKEISYIHAEAYPAGEMKHGPIAMISEEFPTVAIVPNDSVRQKTISNIQEIRARKGPILAIATQGDHKIRELVDDVVYIPRTHEMLNPLLSVIPLQLLAYYIGAGLGYDVDKPRNLAKSVTVE